jgi:autotransporter-associated beta strand protein
VAGVAANLTWKGGLASNAWDLTTTKNFLNGGTADFFYNGDNVTFDDTGSTSPAISITGTLSPGSVTVNNTANAYTFAGTGSIAGTTGLVKNGANSLTISNANTYTGGTTLNAGQLNINNASAIGSGLLTITGGTLDNTSAGAITLSTNNAQAWNGDFAFAGTNDLNLGTGAVTMSGNRVVTVNAGNLTVGGAIAGTGYGLTKAGAGTLTLSGANSYTGATNINGGKLLLSTNSSSLTAGAYGIGSTATLEINTGASTWLAVGSPSFSGAGTLTKTGTGTLQLGSSGSAAAVMSMGSGSLIDIQAGTIELDWSYNKTTWSTNLADMNIAAGATFDTWDYGSNNGANIKIGALSGSGTVTRGGSNPGNGRLEVGVDGGSANFSGIIQNPTLTATLSVIKSGTGTQTLSGANTYTGGTTVTQGTLAIGGSGSILVAGGASGLTINSGATFALNGTLQLALNSSQISNSGTFDLSVGSPVLDLNGKITGLTDGETINLFSTTGTITGNFSNIIGYDTAHYTASFNNINGQLLFTAVPEPGAWVSLLGGCAVLLGLRRRRY